MEEKLFDFVKKNSENNISYNEYLARELYNNNEYIDISFLKDIEVANLEFSRLAYFLILGREIDEKSKVNHEKIIRKNSNKIDFIKRQFVINLIKSREATNKGKKYYNNVFDTEETRNKYQKISRKKIDIKDYVYHKVFLKSPSIIKIISRKFYYKFIRKD